MSGRKSQSYTNVSEKPAASTFRLDAGYLTIVTRLQARRSGVRIPAGSRKIPDRLWGPPASYSMDTGSSFPPGGEGGSRPGRDADHSPTPSAEVKNE